MPTHVEDPMQGTPSPFRSELCKLETTRRKGPLGGSLETTLSSEAQAPTNLDPEINQQACERRCQRVHCERLVLEPVTLVKEHMDAMRCKSIELT